MGIVYNVVYVIEDIKTVYSHWQSGMHYLPCCSSYRYVRVPKAGKYKCNGEGYKIEINRSQYKMEAYITGKL